MTTKAKVPPCGTTTEASPLFRLPLELREAIYSFLNVQIDVTGPTSGLWEASELMPVHMYVPEPRAYLICHQFTAELKDHVRRSKSARFLVEDHVKHQEWPSLDPRYCHLDIPLKDSLTATCSINLNHDQASCEQPDQCMVAQEVRVDIRVTWSDQDLNEWPESRHGSLLKDVVKSVAIAPFLTRLRVLRQDKTDINDLESQRELWVSWGKASGWQVPGKSSAAS